MKNFRIDIFFQPIVNLNSRETIGFEALMRGFNEKNNIIYPKEIFDNLDQEKKEKLDLEAFTLAIIKAKKLKLYEKYKLFINVSYAFSEDIIKTLNSLNYPKNKIIIEICESIPEEKFKSYISTLSKEDISLAIDDFGSKQSNIDRLLSCQNCNWIKIDKKFTSFPFVSFIFSYLNKKLNYNIVIECVEKEDDLPLSKYRKNFFAQGFLFGKPSPTPLY